MSWNILEHSFTVKCFAEITSSRTPSSFPSQSLSSFLLTSCLYSVPLAACLEFSKWQPFFLWLHLCLIRILLPSLSFVTYLPHFHLLAKSSFTYLFFWTITWVFHCETEVTLHTLLCVKWMTCTGTNHRPTLKGVTGLVTDAYTHLLSMLWFVDWTAVQAVLSATPHS